MQTVNDRMVECTNAEERESDSIAYLDGHAAQEISHPSLDRSTALFVERLCGWARGHHTDHCNQGSKQHHHLRVQTWVRM